MSPILLYSRCQCAPRSSHCANLSPRLLSVRSNGISKHTHYTHRTPHDLIRYDSTAASSSGSNTSSAASAYNFSSTEGFIDSLPGPLVRCRHHLILKRLCFTIKHRPSTNTLRKGPINCLSKPRTVPTSKSMSTDLPVELLMILAFAMMSPSICRSGTRTRTLTPSRILHHL